MTESEWTWDDTSDLLTWINGYDGREAGKSDMMAWYAAGKEGRWTSELATRAVTAHYLAAPDTWIRPGHVHSRVRSWREDDLSRQAGRREIEAPARARPVRQLVGRLAARWTEPAEEADESPDAALTSLAVACPFEGCRAPAGAGCIVGGMSSAGRRLRSQPHPSRHVALAEAAVAIGQDPSVDNPVKCPTCGADPNMRCVNLSNGSYISFRLGQHYRRMVAIHGETDAG